MNTFAGQLRTSLGLFKISVCSKKNLKKKKNKKKKKKKEEKVKVNHYIGQSTGLIKSSFKSV